MTFDVHRFALGWFESWIQWGFWATQVYFIAAMVFDVWNAPMWRRHRDTFYALVFSVELSILAGYWLLQVPIQAATGYGAPSHATYNDLVENYLSPTLPPLLALIDFVLVSHKPGNFFIELIFVAIYSVGYIISDIVRHSFTGRYNYPIQAKSYGFYWVILVVLAILAFLAYRGLSILLRRLRTKMESCYVIMYDSDLDDDSVESRRKLINDDLQESLRFGRLDGREAESCLMLSLPAISIFIIIQTVELSFVINYLLRNWNHGSPSATPS